MSHSNTHTHIFLYKITRGHTHYSTHVPAALNTSHLTDLHLQLTLTKVDTTIGPLLVLHFKNGGRKASVIHPLYRHKHTNKHTHTHTRARTHRNAYVTATLFTSHLTDPHLQVALTKFKVTLG